MDVTRRAQWDGLPVLRAGRSQTDLRTAGRPREAIGEGRRRETCCRQVALTAPLFRPNYFHYLNGTKFLPQGEMRRPPLVTFQQIVPTLYWPSNSPDAGPHHPLRGVHR